MLFARYTIDPHTRYGTRLKTKTILSVERVRHLINTGSGTLRHSNQRDASPANVTKPRRSAPLPPATSKPKVAPSMHRHSAVVDLHAEDRKRKKLRGDVSSCSQQ